MLADGQSIGLHRLARMRRRRAGVCEVARREINEAENTNVYGEILESCDNMHLLNVL